MEAESSHGRSLKQLDEATGAIRLRIWTELDDAWPTSRPGAESLPCVVDAPTPRRETCSSILPTANGWRVDRLARRWSEACDAVQRRDVLPFLQQVDLRRWERKESQGPTARRFFLLFLDTIEEERLWRRTTTRTG